MLSSGYENKTQWNTKKQHTVVPFKNILHVANHNLRRKKNNKHYQFFKLLIDLGDGRTESVNLPKALYAADGRILDRPDHGPGQ
jgi:hypothetical protein